jgi:predicted amidohydrolase YtcJ
MDNSILLFNGNILTLSPKMPRCEAVVLRGGKIVACGTSAELKTHYKTADQCIDLKQKTVLPGFIDTHAHLTGTGVHTLGVDLGAAHSIIEIQNKLAAFAKQIPAGEWFFGHSFDDSVLVEKRYPTRYDLDTAVPDHPVYLVRRDGHSSVVNSLALRLINLPPETNGVERDDQTGEPTGIMRRAAVGLTQEKMSSQMSRALRLQGIQAAAQAAMAKGITTIHALEGGRATADENLAVLLKHQDELPVRIVVYQQTCDVGRVQKAGLPRIGGCLLIDGSIGSRTAAVTEPFSDDAGNSGVLYFTDAELYEFIETAHCAGLQIAMHALGDRAIDQLLKTYRQVLAKHPRANHRHRIEHFVLPRPEQIPHAAALGLLLAMQPAFDYFWGGEHRLYAARLGALRSLFSNPLRTILDAGIKVAGGSDSYVTPMDPLLGIHAAVNHHSPTQRISVGEAIHMFTTAAAYAAFEEDQKGTIEPGKLADLVVLEKNPYDVAVTELKNIRVNMTICRGEIVFRESRSEP